MNSETTVVQQEEAQASVIEIAPDDIVSSPVAASGGLGGLVAVTLRSNHPVVPQRAIAVFDTCDNNVAASGRRNEQFRFYRLAHSGPAWLANKLKDPQNAAWKGDFSRHLKIGEGDIITDKGALEARNRSLVPAVEDLDNLEKQAATAANVCGYPSISTAVENARFWSLVHSLGGGSGGTINHHLAMLLRLKYGDVDAAKDSWVRVVGLGSTLYLNTRGMGPIYKGIQAAELKAASRLMLYGTADPDTRLAGCLPGFEGRTKDDVLPAGYIDEFTVLEAVNSDAGELPLDLVAEMAAADIHCRSKFPAVVRRLKELQVEERDKIEDDEIAEGAAFRFSTFGARFIVPHPNQDAVRERQVSLLVVQDVLKQESADDVTQLSFSGDAITELFQEWVGVCRNNGVHQESASSMQAQLENDPSIASAELKTRANDGLPQDVRTVFSTEINVGEVANKLSREALQEVATRKRSGNLKPLAAGIEHLVRRLRGITTPRVDLSNNWEADVDRLVAGIDEQLGKVNVPKERPSGFFRGIIHDAMDSESDDVTIDAAAQRLVRQRAGSAAAIIAKLQKKRHDDLIWTRVLTVRDKVVEALEAELLLLKELITRFEQYVDGAEGSIDELWEQGAAKDSVITHVVAESDLDAIRSSASVPPGSVEETLRRILDEGREVMDAVAHTLAGRGKFGTAALAKGTKSRDFFLKAVANLRVQAPIDKNEYGRSKPLEFKFIVCPTEAAEEVKKICGEGWQVFAVEEDVFWIEIALCNLPARAIRTTFTNENALEGLDEKHFELCHIWNRHKLAGSLTFGNRAQVEREVAAALLLSTKLLGVVKEQEKPEVVPLKINGFEVLSNAREAEFENLCPLSQEDKPSSTKGVLPEWYWKIRLGVEGDNPITRTIRTNHPTVLVDIISTNADYRDVLDEWVRKCVLNLDYSARAHLAETIDQLRKWRRTVDHFLAERKEEAEEAERLRLLENPETLKKVLEEYEPLLPWIDMLLRGAEVLNADRRWVQNYKRQRPSDQRGLITSVKFAQA